MSNYDPTDIRSQERAKADTDLRNKLVKDTEESDLKWLMGSKRGRRIVWRTLERSCIDKCIFNTNAMTMAFVSGRQLEGANLKELINRVCPELYPVMVKEQIHDNRNPDDGSRNDH